MRGKLMLMSDGEYIRFEADRDTCDICEEPLKSGEVVALHVNAEGIVDVLRHERCLSVDA